MDGSFLSNQKVVDASRNFVCIRLATYEDKQEAEFLKNVFTGRSGQLENTVFAILSPDGRRKLVRPGRGPSFAFRDAEHMAESMNRIARQYARARSNGDTDRRVPYMKSLDLALNVASCDRLPVVVVVGDSPAQVRQIQQGLAGPAWSSELIGQFVYASVSKAKQLKPILGHKSGAGILVVHPDAYGVSGTVVKRLDPSAEQDTIQTTLQQIAANYQSEDKVHGSHIRMGIQMGIDWDTEIPVTDAQSLRAKERARGGR